jgi:hypothetical protein
VAVDSAAATTLFGPAIIDSTGAGVLAAARASFGVYMANLSAYAWSSYGNGVVGTVAYNRQIYAIRLKKVGTAYSTSYAQIDASVKAGFAGFGTTEPFSSTTTWAGTPDRIGIGCAYTDAGLTSVTILRFTVT